MSREAPRMRRGSAGLAAAATAALALVLALATTDAAAAAVAPPAAGVEPAAALDGGPGWSAAQMQHAEGLAPPAAAATEAAPLSGIAARVRFGSKRLANAGGYPNRVHGRLFGRFPGLGPYSCSATVITSRSRSLIATAGHCLFDAGLTNRFAANVVFVPGYRAGEAPYGAWRATHGVTTGQWARRASLDHDVAFLRLARREGRGVEQVVGSRGIGFGQPRKGRLLTYGYPVTPARKFDGEQLIRCNSRQVRDPIRHSPTPSIGTGCDMRQGASGGGMVAQSAFVVSNVSHGHPGARDIVLGPYYGKAVKRTYRTDRRGAFPSIRPIRCGGRLATIVGTDRDDTIRGSKRNDVIATLGGNDKIRSKGGNDLICAGPGNDRIFAGPGRDRILAGPGRDRCDGGGGRDRARGCERSRRIP
jgi:hypothetical protein